MGCVRGAPRSRRRPRSRIEERMWWRCSARSSQALPNVGEPVLHEDRRAERLCVRAAGSANEQEVSIVGADIELGDDRIVGARGEAQTRGMEEHTPLAERRARPAGDRHRHESAAEIDEKQLASTSRPVWGAPPLGGYF